MSDVYKAFEDRFRGSRDLILSRLEVYRPLIEAVSSSHPEARAVDLGCGRGEWLELLASIPVVATGVDIDAEMLAEAKRRDFDVVNADALDYIRSCDANSLSIVSAFHVIEHIDNEQLNALLHETLRALTPGGIAIFETPNPENINVSAVNFHLDPSHKSPLPPMMVEFFLEYHGFETIGTWRLQDTGLPKERSVELSDVIYSVSPDYAVIGQKPLGQPASASGEGISHVSRLIREQHGISLKEMVRLYDSETARLKAQIDEMQKELQRLATHLCKTNRADD